MANANVFSCFIIGDDTLLAECGDLLLQGGHQVRGVITTTDRVARWAGERELPVIDAAGDYLTVLKSQPFDYLFSITYLQRIPDAALEQAGRMAINFHDGPLPCYAGRNAPSWALLNGETEYGISWHVVRPGIGIDSGELLLQIPFDIADDETSLSLNTKCFAAALESFPKLLTGLAGGTLQLQNQDSAARSYCSQYNRPARAGLLDWRRGAAELERQVRALDFGPYPNPLGSAQALFAGVCYIVTQAVAEPTAAASSAAPGEIVAVGDQAIRVATGAGVLSISGFSSPSAEPLSTVDFIRVSGAKTGQSFHGLAAQDAEEFDLLAAGLAKNEPFWISRLENMKTVQLPFADYGSAAADYRELTLTLPTPFRSRFDDATADVALAGFALLLARLTGQFELTLCYSGTAPGKLTVGLQPLLSELRPLTIKLDDQKPCTGLLAEVAAELDKLRARGLWLRDLPARQPQLKLDREALRQMAAVSLKRCGEGEIAALQPSPDSLLTLVVDDAGQTHVWFDTGRLPAAGAEQLLARFQRLLDQLGANPQQPLSRLDLLSAEERQLQLTDWNDTAADLPAGVCVHQLFEQQAERTPDAVALVFEDDTLSYAELNRRANQLARYLQRLGAGPDTLIGVHVERSLELVVATLGVLKAGAAYVPLDPAFPAERIAMMVEDAAMPIVIGEAATSDALSDATVQQVRIDADWRQIATAGDGNPHAAVAPDNLAYVIYTSGSTGRPKGVMVEHRNVVNFFTGMDAHITHEPPGTWLAVTSLSFDISVLELFWTLARGFKVVVFRDRDRAAPRPADDPDIPAAVRNRPMDFGLFMWGNDDAPGRAKYRLLLEGAKYFDRNGFNSVWTPERHFHAFGGPFPNPSVTGAALAAVTENLSIRAGSCVSPLHHPVRIAEEWAVVDNLSNGRVGLSFASGWQPNDFVIKPENYKNNKTIMLEQIDTVRKLWRGEKVAFANPLGQSVEVTTLPRPVQKDLPFWVTTAGNPDTYRNAGSVGANVLTHLLGQSLDELAEKIGIYREARRAASLDPETGKVTLMLHTFVGADDDHVREQVREPMKAYLRSSLKLVFGFAWSFPAFKRPAGADSLDDVDLASLSEEEIDAVLDFAFERYFETSGLFGSPTTAAAMVNRCKQAGVDEIACLLDFGVDTDAVLESLPYLKQVRDLGNTPVGESTPTGTDYSLAAQIRRHQVSHLQCTPSMARMLTLDNDARAALGQVDHVLVGGEVLTAALAKELRALLPAGATLTNMYGPTETTVWSTCHPVATQGDPVAIGRPIANTQVYILDRQLQPLPPGLAGELYIGGYGVVRGYHRRPELTAERFVDDPFSAVPGRLYRTGDLARYRDDGVIEFLGRADHQVKIRGYRIELGEIEARLEQQADIREAAVTLREDTPGDQRLIAYLVSRDPGLQPQAARLRDRLRQFLPEYMLPGDFVTLDRLPLTPNGKVDRNALPAPQTLRAASRPAQHVEPASGLQQTVAELWRKVLNLPKVGINDNFFDLGGHSLLVVRLHREMREALQQPVSLTDLYRFPTVRSLTDHLSAGGAPAGLQQSSERAQKRRALQQRRRRG